MEAKTAESGFVCAAGTVVALSTDAHQSAKCIGNEVSQFYFSLIFLFNEVLRGAASRGIMIAIDTRGTV
jgi:hypothetical protein